MKTIKLMIKIVLVVCIILFLGFFIFLKTVDLNRFKAQITQQASKAIGRDVEMKHVSFDFSVIHGITLHISGLSIMDSPEFSSAPMLYIDSSHLDVDALSFLLKRQVLISKVEFNSLNINLIRSSDGKINFQALGQKTTSPSEENKAEEAPSSNTSSSKEDDVRDFDFGELLIRSARITDGTFIFTDHMATPVTMIPITHIELDISNVSMKARFPFEVKASVFSKRRNIFFSGLAQIDTRNNQVRIDDLKIQTDLSEMISGRLNTEIPSLTVIGLQGKNEGKLVIDVHQMILGEDGLLVLSSDGRLTDGKISFKDSPVPIEDLNTQFEVTESDVEITEMTMPLASGEIKMSGRVIEYLGEQKFFMNLNTTNIQLSELATQADFPVQLNGQIYAQFKLNGKGIDQKSLATSLAGEGTGEIKNGRVVDVNILKLVLSKISFIPNLAGQIEANLPEKYKEKLKAKDTVLQKVEISAKIHQGTLFINRAEVNADGFLVIATGKMDFNQNLSLNADLYIPSDLSASMIAVTNELSYLLDEQKQIHIPFRPYSGKLANFQMYPDVEDIGKEIIRNRGKEELRKVIFKALDLDDRISGEAPSQDGQQIGRASCRERV